MTKPIKSEYKPPYKDFNGEYKPHQFKRLRKKSQIGKFTTTNEIKMFRSNKRNDKLY